MKSATASRVNLRHLRAFAFVVELGTVRAAAEEAGLSQPAVTQALARLEQHFGIVLFERSHSGMRMNSYGAVLYARVKRLFDFLEQMRRRIKLARRRGNGGYVDRMVTMVQLEVLTAVAETKGLSAAARRMGVSEPTVHRAARELEKLVDVPLFLAVSHGIEMTAVGREVARLASLALKELDTAVEELAAAEGLRGGRLVIGSLPLARTEVLPEAIVRLYDDEPRASVEIMEGQYDALIHMLRTGEIDVIVGALRDPLGYDDIGQAVLFDDDLSVIARAGHPLADRAQVSMQELAAFPWTVPRKGTPTRAHFDTLFSGCLPEGGLVETSSMVIVRALLLKSDRLTLLSRRQVLYEEQLGLLVALPISMPSTSRAIGFTTRSNWQPTRLQTKFLEHLHLVSRNVAAERGSTEDIRQS